MKRDHLDFMEVIYANQNVLIGIMSIIIIPALIIITWIIFNSKRVVKSGVAPIMIGIMISITLASITMSIAFLYATYKQSHQTHITGEDTVTVKEVKKNTSGNDYWTFKSNGHTYKVTYDTNPNESELPPTSVNKGDKIKVKVDNAFVNKDNEIYIDRIECDVLD